VVAARSVRISLDPDQSFDEFFTRSSAKLMRSAYLPTGNRIDAEDVVQAALIRTARRWEVVRLGSHIT
jgi:DNA-directed RNA polymerase specialized sigma24 family protein